jgi:hypothetical protein
MAFSNTVSKTVFNTGRVIDNAFRRCKLTAEQITSEYVDIANDQLYLFLSDLANQGAPLWCIEKQIYPLYTGVGDVTTTDGTVDILNANLRYLQEVTGTNFDTSTERKVYFSSPAFVTSVGIFWAAASVPLIFERSDDDITWVEVQSETPVAVAGEKTWYDLDSSVASVYFRVRATSGTLSFDMIYLGNTPTQIPLARMNRDDYTNLPNLFFQSNRPLQYWFDRQVNNPIMHLWPVPNDGAATYQIVLWRQRYIMDVGTMTQELEIPQRWFLAVQSMLAHQMSMEMPGIPVDRITYLEGQATKYLYDAEQEERDKSPIYYAPNISVYTR